MLLAPLEVLPLSSTSHIRVIMFTGVATPMAQPMAITPSILFTTRQPVLSQTLVNLHRMLFLLHSLAVSHLHALVGAQHCCGGTKAHTTQNQKGGVPGVVQGEIAIR